MTRRRVLGWALHLLALPLILAAGRAMEAADGWDGASGIGFVAGALLLAASEELRRVSPHPGARGTTDEA